MTAPWEESARLGISVERLIVGADLVRLAMAEGDAGLAWQVAAAAGDVASRNELAWLRGAARRCQGLAENDARALAAAYAGASGPLELALASEDAATAFVKQGNLGRARPLLAQAIAIYERLHAGRDLARADAVLRRAGVQRGIRGPRNRPQFGWQSLTPTERTVADLVADGLSNRRSGSGCSSPGGPSRPTWHTCSPSWASPPAPCSPPRSRSGGRQASWPVTPGSPGFVAEIFGGACQPAV